MFGVGCLASEVHFFPLLYLDEILEVTVVLLVVKPILVFFHRGAEYYKKKIIPYSILYIFINTFDLYILLSHFSFLSIAKSFSLFSPFFILNFSIFYVRLTIYVQFFHSHFVQVQCLNR